MMCTAECECSDPQKDDLTFKAASSNIFFLFALILQSMKHVSAS